MGMSLDRMLYLQAKGVLPPGKARLLDMGPQNVYGVTPEQIRKFVGAQGQAVSDETLDAEVQRLVYFSTPRPEERTTLLSEITDLTPIEYNSYDICPGLKTDIVDLNFDTILPSHRGNYDVVLNFGTTEHIFNQWNSFKIIHEATKVGGHMYFQLPMSGYLDHGYYCYTPLFFTDMAAANDYELVDLFVTEAGMSDMVALGIDVRDGADPLVPNAVTLPPSSTRITSFNIHALVRKTSGAGFRCGAEIATAHAPIDQRIKDNYAAGVEQDDPLGQRQKLIAQLVEAVGRAQEEIATYQTRLEHMRESTSWRVTGPLRALGSLFHRR